MSTLRSCWYSAVLLLSWHRSSQGLVFISKASGDHAVTWISLKSHHYATTEMVFINGNILKRETFIKVTKMTVLSYYGMEKTNQSKQPNKNMLQREKKKIPGQDSKLLMKYGTDPWALGSKNSSFKESSVFNNDLSEISQKQKRILLQKQSKEGYKVWDRDSKRCIYFGNVGCLHRLQWIQEGSALEKSGLLFIVPHKPFFEWAIES